MVHEDDDNKNALMFKGGAGGCPTGQILRRGYVATRRNTGLVGRVLKRTTTYRVPPTCVRDTGKPGKGLPVIGPLRKGPLTALGYSTSIAADTRRKALAKAVKKYGRLATFRRLHAAAILTHNTVPSKSKTLKSDRDWVKKTYF